MTTQETTARKAKYMAKAKEAVASGNYELAFRLLAKGTQA